MLYVPSAFAAVITVVTIDALARRRAVAIAIVAALTLSHAVLLQRMHARWRGAARVFDGVTRSFISEARANDPGAGGLMFILSLPDNVRGAYVFRRGFYAALHFLAPDLEARAASIVPVESQSMWRPDDVTVARRNDATSMSLDVTPNMFLSAAPPVRPFYTFPEWTRSSYTLQFTAAIGKGAVFHVSGSRASFLVAVAGPGAPFGSIDIPEDGAPCRDALRFSGWALDDRLVSRVGREHHPARREIRASGGEVNGRARRCAKMNASPADLPGQHEEDIAVRRCGVSLRRARRCTVHDYRADRGHPDQREGRR
jgi:hypothetical protein